MSDIDFLATKKREDDLESKNKNSRKEKIDWSEPEDNRAIPKGTAFSMLSFINKKKAVGKSPEPPAAAPKPEIDQSKIRRSRREILELIKNHESTGAVIKNNQSALNGNAVKNKTGRGWLAGLLEKFKGQPSRKEVLIDYHRIINQEKIGRSLPASPDNRKINTPAVPIQAPINRVKEIEPKKIEQPPKIRPEKEKKLAAPRPVKKFKESFFSQLVKYIKNKISALSMARGPVKIDLAEINEEAAPKIIEVSRPKPVVEHRPEIKMKDRPLKETEPIQINVDSPKVLETNLIKGEIITFFDWRKKSIILINAALIPVLLIGLIYLGLTYYQKQSQAQTQDQAVKLDRLEEELRLAELGLEEITDFQSRLETVSKIFSQHIYWTNFFKFLEDNTSQDVYYAGFSGDTSGNYPLSAMALRFSNISEQVDIFRNNQKVAGVKTTGGEFLPGDAGSRTGVKFDLNLSIFKSIFTE